MPAFEDLVNIIASGYPVERKDLTERAENAIKGLFGERYRKDTAYARRIALCRATITYHLLVWSTGIAHQVVCMAACH